MDLHQHLSRISTQKLETASQITRDAITTHLKTASQDIQTASELYPVSLCYCFRNPFSSTTMGDENPIRTLGDYSKPSHEGYRNTIELPVGNNVVLLRSDTIRRTIDQSAGGKLHDRNAEESWALLEDLAIYDNESWNDPRDFAKPVKAIALPQDVPSTSDSHLIELENKFQCLMEAHLALTQPTQVNKITTSCEICSGPHYTQYCMKDPEQAFVEYASSRTDEAGGRIKGMHVFVGNFTYIVDFMIIEEISSIIDPRLSQVVLGKPFEEMSNMTHDPPEGVVRRDTYHEWMAKEKSAV
ncbi:hypothetical protein Tco_1010595 [Tanacetum coccineum]